jgi:hypothetical protein
MSVGTVPQWFPEYGLRLGRPRGGLPRRVAALRRRSGVFVRRYARGLVAVNPRPDALSVALPRPMRLVQARGGGEIGPSGRAGGRLRTRLVRGRLTLPARSGAVLLRHR